jgi:molybdopterin converting factor small subunit
MTNQITIKIKLFGFLQNCSNEEEIEITTSCGSRVYQVKELLLKKLSGDERLAQLPQNCVLANDEEILFDDFELRENINLVVLPPVCGG